MIICPSCSGALPSTLICTACKWRAQYREGLPVLVSETDLRDDINRLFTEDYDQIAKRDLAGNVMDERYIQNLAANFCSVIDIRPGAEVCDVGSGKGYLVRRMLDRGAAVVTAVDISLPYLVRLVGQPGVSPVLANAEALPFADHFDVVVATDVLEHVLNVGSFLYSMNRALRVNGNFYVRVPFRENLLQYSPHFGCPSRFGHLRTYDRLLLRQALEETGFVVERVWYDGYVPGFARWIWLRGPLRRRSYQWFEDRLARRGGNWADVTRRPHRVYPIFLRPTVIIAAARKVKSLIPLQGGGFGFA